MLAAGEGELVDVGAPAGGPVGDVVHLGQIAGHITARVGTAPIPRMQHDALIGAGQAFGAAQPQRAPVHPVEDRQIVPGVAGHPDHLGHRQHGVPAGVATPVPACRSCRVVRTTIDTGRP